MTAGAALTAWLDELEAAHTAASKGPWHADGHELYMAWPGIPDMAGDWIGETCDIDDLDQSNANAAAIVAAHNALPELIRIARQHDALVRGVAELAEDLDSYVAARGRPATGTYDHGLNRAQAAIAADLRRLLADAAPGEAR